jgi:transcriptional regulator of arginine metabolism
MEAPRSQASCYIIGPDMPAKRARQTAILALVRQHRIDSQQQLADELGRQGLDVSQSTLSRDIRELGLVKAGNAYIVRPGGPRRNADHTLRLVLREFLVDVDSVERMMVLKTTSGSANTVADALEGARWEGVAGTIAGEDTIFVLCRSLSVVADLRGRIRELTE